VFTESAEFYDALYAFRDYTAETARLAAIVRAAHPGARSILDVACGTGEHAMRLARDHGFDVDGLDLDDGLLRAARTKHPAGTFFHGDMSGFALETRYDAVLCLFSAIGYLVTFERTVRALDCFRRHLRPRGVVIVEPWFRPGELEDDRVVRLTAAHGDAQIERTGRTRIDGRVSRLHFDYRIDAPGGTRHVSEVHELGLFTVEEMAAALEEAGLHAEYDPVGLSGRGLWVAR